jgi:DNA repair protein RecN (Recombination protein N)
LITEVSIKNLSLADKIEFNLNTGFNVFTGETGAGKSLVISAIAFAFGMNSDFARLRKENETAHVSVTITPGPDAKETLGRILEESAIEAGDDEIIITRSITPDSKTKNSVNSVKVAAALLNKIGRAVVEISGQNDELLLLEPKAQFELSDRYCGKRLAALKNSLFAIYSELKNLIAERGELKRSEGERAKMIDLYSFQINEIKNAGLYEGEDAGLNERVEFLKNAEKIAQIKDEICALLDGGDEGPAIGESLSRLGGLVSKLSKFDHSFETTAAALNDAYFLLDEVSDGVSALSNRLDYSQDELNEKISRLHAISLLKRKYGAGISEVIAYCADCEKKLEQLQNFEQNYSIINSKIDGKFAEYISAAEGISKIRHENKEKIEQAINGELSTLDMKNANFKLMINQIPDFDESKINPNGLETVEFFIRANPGTPFAPIAKIASGGEMSRIMLAVKNVLSAYSKVPSVIFDEIDTGIGGFTLNAVGSKLRSIASSKQVICVTHSPIIASFASHHFLVNKEIINGEKTSISFVKLNRDSIEGEIARMLGNDSEIGISHARELLSKNKS